MRDDSLFHSAEIQFTVVCRFHTVRAQLQRTHAHTHLRQSGKKTHFNGLRYRYRTQALTFPSASPCSTPVRTTGYPCPPKPHTPHLHINLLFNIILCHSRPICHSACRPPPSEHSIHILKPGPSLVLPLFASPHFLAFVSPGRHIFPF